MLMLNDIEMPQKKVIEALHGAYSSLLEGVAWLAQTMLPICVYISYLQRCGKAPTCGDIRKINRLL
eukprot:5181151-Karenia_brevis.AAC.1